MNFAAKKFSKVYIEISNICNLQCDFCPEVERQKKIMSYELFSEIIDQVKDLTEEVTFHLMGEPLTHPKLAEFMEKCASSGVPVNITTNGTLLLHKNYADVLLSPIVRQVNFSLQSFVANYPQKDMKPYLQNIFAFTRRAFELRPDLYINYRLWNMGSVQATVSGNSHFLEPISEEFNYELRTPVDVGFKKSRHVKNRLYLHFDSRFEWPSLKAAVSGERGFCYGLKSHFAIHADGTVVPCCLDKEAGLALGKVAVGSDSALSILAALNSERARRLREGFDQFEIREELCRRCSFIRRFDKKKSAAKAVPLTTVQNAKFLI